MLTHTKLDEMEKHLNHRAEKQDAVANNLVDVTVPVDDLKAVLDAAHLHLVEQGFTQAPPSLIDLVESILDEEDKDSLLREMYSYISDNSKLYRIMQQHVEDSNERQRSTVSL